MSRSDCGGTRSTAAIFGHPIHPLIVVFPISFLVATLATDLAFWGTRDQFWARASEWLLGAGILMGVLAAVAGLIDFVTISRVRSLTAGWLHFLGNVAAILLALWNLLLRLGGAPGATVVPFGIVLSALVVGIFIVTGWLGGELVFRHHVGMIEEKREAPPSIFAASNTTVDVSRVSGRRTRL